MTEIEDRWRDLGEFIREQRRVGQLSLRKLSEMAGISNPYLSQIERGMRKPSAEILRQIAGALHISAETLYVRAGILDERDGEHDLVADIRRDPYIDEDQKKTLEHIYRSFRAAFLADLEARGIPLPDPGGAAAPEGTDATDPVDAAAPEPASAPVAEPEPVVDPAPDGGNPDETPAAPDVAADEAPDERPDEG